MCCFGRLLCRFAHIEKRSFDPMINIAQTEPHSIDVPPLRIFLSSSPSTVGSKRRIHSTIGKDVAS